MLFAADVVLLLGPLYHLADADDRWRALQEACRVLMPGGMIFLVAEMAPFKGSQPMPILSKRTFDELDLPLLAAGKSGAGRPSIYFAHARMVYWRGIEDTANG